MEFETICVRGGEKEYDRTGALSVPIYQTAAFAHPGLGQSTGYDYSRSQNPTREYLEHVVAALENGTEAVAFSSGMASLTTLAALFAPGDHIIVSDDLYGGTHRLFTHLATQCGLVFTFMSTTDAALVAAAFRPATKAVFIETPTNPMMHVTDIAATAALCRERGVRLIVDNTFLTPVLQKPLVLGADIVMHSGTKYLGGHNDTLAGLLIVRDGALAEKLRYFSMSFGTGLSPFDSWLLIRGIKTLALRVRRQEENARRIATWLEGRPEIRALYYPGRKEHPQYEISCRQAQGFGAMISFEVADPSLVRQVLENVRVIRFAESLGGVDSLMTYPVLQTHADIPEEKRLAQGINDRLLRISVGIEAAADLIADLAQAFGD
ncbi:MAG: PLP-dependent aspartate aminotransferase family protein [Gracilibacteraceae bacterium]|jgi:cystathionine gamma-synthase|nr:PLP-dependent aspartate aminotransferase family protein [Gracilibacteraceae bacterium]